MQSWPKCLFLCHQRPVTKSVGDARWLTCSEEKGVDSFHCLCRRSGSALGADGSSAASARTEAPARPPGPRGPRPSPLAPLPLLVKSWWALLRSRQPRPPVLPPPSWKHLLLFSVELLKEECKPTSTPVTPGPKVYKLVIFAFSLFFLNHSGFSFKQTKTLHN